jgi:hypothetical protein
MTTLSILNNKKKLHSRAVALLTLLCQTETKLIGLGLAENPDDKQLEEIEIRSIQRKMYWNDYCQVMRELNEVTATKVFDIN